MILNIRYIFEYVFQNQERQNTYNISVAQFNNYLKL